jgi:hypothetical protein
MRARRRLADVFFTVVADTAADLTGLLDEIRSESGTGPVRRAARSPAGRSHRVARVRGPLHRAFRDGLARPDLPSVQPTGQGVEAAGSAARRSW